MSSHTGEEAWEQLVIDRMSELDWKYTPGAEVAPGSGERESWHDIVLRGTLDRSLRNLNPEVPGEYLRQAAAEVLTPQSQDAVAENFRLHQILRDGYRGITYVDHDGRERTPVIRFLSGDPAANSYRVVNQVTMRRGQVERRFDVIAYVNGLPLAIMELKQAGSKAATAEAAFNQLQTYVTELPMAFRFAAFVLASDGINARYGTAFTPWNHFASWNVDDDGRPVAMGELGPDGEHQTEIDWTLNGLFNLDR
ncbi:MAG: DEAD/DEAH box helicase, partial [Kocuria sp.]|nr:DEAD/DEAH box helicase [Kocuria sp.]